MTVRSEIFVCIQILWIWYQGEYPHLNWKSCHEYCIGPCWYLTTSPTWHIECCLLVCENLGLQTILVLVTVKGGTLSCKHFSQDIYFRAFFALNLATTKIKTHGNINSNTGYSNIFLIREIKNLRNIENFTMRENFHFYSIWQCENIKVVSDWDSSVSFSIFLW